MFDEAKIAICHIIFCHGVGLLQLWKPFLNEKSYKVVGHPSLHYY